MLLVLATTQLSSSQTKFPEHSFKLNSDPSVNISYLAYVPKTYYSTPRYTPVLIFLHSNEETGGDISRLKKTVPLALADKGANFDFIIIAPHLPVEHGKVWEPELVKQALEDAQSRYRIDPSRVYIMGVAKGGAGAWAFGLKYPELIAAAIPISGYGEVGWACKMKVVPTWAFHKKTKTPANSTLNMVRALQKCSNQVLYNDYSDTWSPQIDDKNVFDWMLAQSKNREFGFSKNRISDKLRSYKLPLALKNPSGILKAKDGSLWSINDAQGKLPLLFNIDTTGKVIKTVRVTGAPNVDWEDITQDDQGNFFIGDIGNENNNRKSFSVYKVAFDQIKSSDKAESLTISFTLPDQHNFPPPATNLNYDLESMFWFDDAIYFFSKNRTKPFSGYSKLYKIPDSPGSHIAQLLDSILVSKQGVRENGWVASASLSPDKKKLALLGYDRVWMITDFENGAFCKGRITEIPMKNTSHKKGLDFFDNSTLLIVDEYFLGTNDGNLYFLSF
jgi:pimeloyl-ACP methyl ester carboxylesterase